MDTKTLEALKASIAKWEMNAKTAKAGLKTGAPITWDLIASRGVIGLGTTGCALCSLFHARGCAGCPVMEKVGVNKCSDTPYEDADEAVSEAYDNREDQESDDFASTEKLVAACEAEAAFLRSLLPAEG